LQAAHGLLLGRRDADPSLAYGHTEGLRAGVRLRVQQRRVVLVGVSVTGPFLGAGGGRFLDLDALGHGPVYPVLHYSESQRHWLGPGVRDVHKELCRMGLLRLATFTFVALGVVSLLLVFGSYALRLSTP